MSTQVINDDLYFRTQWTHWEGGCVRMDFSSHKMNVVGLLEYMICCHKHQDGGAIFYKQFSPRIMIIARVIKLWDSDFYCQIGRQMKTFRISHWILKNSLSFFKSNIFS